MFEVSYHTNAGGRLTERLILLPVTASKYVLSSVPREIGGIFHLRLFGCFKNPKRILQLCIHPVYFLIDFYTLRVHHSCHSDHVLWDLCHYMIL